MRTSGIAPAVALLAGFAVGPSAVAAQKTQMSNIAKADSDAKLSAVRNMRASSFDESEEVLALLPDDQAGWVHAFARGPGRDVDRARVEAAIGGAFPDASPEQKIKIHMILLQVMMEDVTGALRSYAVVMDRDLGSISDDLVQTLEEVRRARARVIRNFAHQKPPRAYAGDDPGAAARAQDRAQRYTQFVQLSTQLMGELEASERELVDVLQTMKRDADSFWQAYSSMRDEESGTRARIMRHH